MREIHYRLLLSPIGGMLCRLLNAKTQLSRIAKAISLVRTNLSGVLSVAELAAAAGMSPSSFHAHFRQATGTTPLQCQKDLRLIEARNLILQSKCSVAEAAFSVGYESPSHFSRDYTRKFQITPSRVGTVSFELDAAE